MTWGRPIWPGVVITSTIVRQILIACILSLFVLFCSPLPPSFLPPPFLAHRSSLPLPPPFLEPSWSCLELLGGAWTYGLIRGPALPFFFFCSPSHPLFCSPSPPFLHSHSLSHSHSVSIFRSHSLSFLLSPSHSIFMYHSYIYIGIERYVDRHTFMTSGVLQSLPSGYLPVSCIGDLPTADMPLAVPVHRVANGGSCLFVLVMTRGSRVRGKGNGDCSPSSCALALHRVRNGVAAPPLPFSRFPSVALLPLVCPAPASFGTPFPPSFLVGYG